MFYSHLHKINSLPYSSVHVNMKSVGIYEMGCKYAIKTAALRTLKLKEKEMQDQV